MPRSNTHSSTVSGLLDKKVLEVVHDMHLALNQHSILRLSRRGLAHWRMTRDPALLEDDSLDET